MVTPQPTVEIATRVLRRFLQHLTRACYDNALSVLFSAPEGSGCTGPSWGQERRLLACPLHLRPLLSQVIEDFVDKTVFFFLGFFEGADFLEKKYGIRLRVTHPVFRIPYGGVFTNIDMDVAHEWVGVVGSATLFRGAREPVSASADYPHPFTAPTCPLLYRLSKSVSAAAARDSGPITVEAFTAQWDPQLVGALSILNPLEYRASCAHVMKRTEHLPRPQFAVPPAVVAAGLRLGPGQEIWVDAWGRPLLCGKTPWAFE